MRKPGKKEIGLLWFSAGLLVLGVLLRWGIRGMGFCGNLCLCAAAFFLLYAAASYGRRIRWINTVRKCLLCFFLIGLAYFFAVEGHILAHAKTDAETEPKAIVVFGAAVHGNVPSYSLKSRLDAAVAYAQDRPDLPIIVSGGKGSGENISEAQCMQEYLINAGIGKQRIVQENKAASTEENVRYSKAILTSMGISPEDPVALVTNHYHLARAEFFWKGAAVPVSASMPPHFWYYTVGYYVREAFGLTEAWVKNLLS